jgi:hypothetical protein
MILVLVVQAKSIKIVVVEKHKIFIRKELFQNEAVFSIFKDKPP